jgi:hypothetical protein
MEKKERDTRLLDFQEVRKQVVSGAVESKELFDFEVNEIIHQTIADVKISGIQDQLRDEIMEGLQKLE